MNSNGCLLLKLIKFDNLRLTNTFFKHKQCHRSTWDRKHIHAKKSSYRNQSTTFVWKKIVIQQSMTQDHTRNARKLESQTCTVNNDFQMDIFNKCKKITEIFTRHSKVHAILKRNRKTTAILKRNRKTTITTAITNKHSRKMEKHSCHNNQNTL